METITDGPWEWGIQYRSQACDAQVYTWPRPCLKPELGIQPTKITVTVFVGADPPGDECSPPPEHRTTRWLFATAVADVCWALPPGTQIQVSVGGGSWVEIPVIGPKQAEDEKHAAHYLAAIPKDCTVRVVIRDALSGREAIVELAPTADRINATVSMPNDEEWWANNRRKNMNGPPGWVTGDPFSIYSSAACMPGADFAKEAQPMARRRLETGEQCAVEGWLWRHFRESNPIPVGGECGRGMRKMPWPRARLEICLSRLEMELTRTLGGIGVLHVPAVVAMRLASLGSIWTDLKGWFTPLGTPVVFGVCYEPSVGPVDNGNDPNQIVMYGTGPVTVRRGPISTHEGFDQVTNELAAIAERTYAVTTDCALLYTACPNDWCGPDPELPDDGGDGEGDAEGGEEGATPPHDDEKP
ncbi:hypothetical protein [Streptomyces noursei]